MTQNELPIASEPTSATTVEFPVPCWCGCGETTRVRVEFGKHMTWKALPPEPGPGYARLTDVVEHYKKVKGFDKLRTWDGSHRGRAMRAAKQIRHFLRRTAEPVELARELIDDTAKELGTKGLSWSIETCFSRSGEWFARKQKD